MRCARSRHSGYHIRRGASGRLNRDTPINPRKNRGYVYRQLRVRVRLFNYRNGNINPSNGGIRGISRGAIGSCLGIFSFIRVSI